MDCISDAYSFWPHYENLYLTFAEIRVVYRQKLQTLYLAQNVISGFQAWMKSLTKSYTKYTGFNFWILIKK